MEQSTSSILNRRNIQQFNVQQKFLESHIHEWLFHDAYDVSSEHKAGISVERHEWSRSVTSSPELSAISIITDLFDSEPSSGSIEPLLRALLNFISKTSQENKTHPSPSACFNFAKLSLGRFRLWSRSFEERDCDLSQIIDDSPSLKKTVILLLSSLTTILVAEFGYLCDRDSLIKLKNALSQLHPSPVKPSEQPSDSDSEEYNIDADWETSSVDGSTRSDDTSVVEQLVYIVDSLFGLLPALHHLSKTTIAWKERSQTFSQKQETMETIMNTYSTIIGDKYPEIKSVFAQRLAQGVIEIQHQLGILENDPSVDVQPCITTLVTESIRPSTFHDSGLGSSLRNYPIWEVQSMASGHSDLKTVNSPGSNSNRWLPSMPKPGERCPICDKIQKLQAKKDWRKHVFSDLRPYMCIDCECLTGSQQSFGNLEEWMQHDLITHRKRYQQEIKPHGGSDRELEDIPPCPFGCSPSDCAFQKLWHTWKHWYSHVGHHMEDIRLLAVLPSLRLDNGFDTNDSEKSSSNNEAPLHHEDLTTIAEEPVTENSLIIPQLAQEDNTYIPVEAPTQSEPAHTTLPTLEDSIVPLGESPAGKQKADTIPTIKSATQSLPSKNMPKEPKFDQQPVKKISYIDSTDPTPHPAAVATSPTGPSTRSGGAPGARTSTSTSGPLPRGTATGSIIDQLNSQIHRVFREFHDHSKECHRCCNPILTYQDGRHLCYTGRGLAANVTKLLYKKAEHVPQGTFTIEYKQGWESVDGLIKIITHYNQGYYSNKIVDVKRVPRDTRPAAIENCGSQYEEDLRRHELAAAQSAQQNGYGPPRRSPQRTNETLAVYGDPRTSFLDGTGRTQEDSSGPSSTANSSRSVRFDTHIRVREYET